MHDMQEMKPEEREEWLAKQNHLITKAFISMAMPIRARYIDGMVDYGMPRSYSMRTQCHELEGSQMCLIVRLVKIDLLRKHEGNPNMNGYVPLVLL